MSVRDADYERTFLKEVAAAVTTRYGVDVDYYAARVEHRLEIGAERYGDSSFTEKDIVPELLEETPDVAAYALLEVQKGLADPDEQDNRGHWLFECAVAAAWADYCARQARR